MAEFEPTDWEERLRLAVAQTLHKRDQRRAERADFAERRNHGLEARYAAKLARKHNQPQKEKPAMTCMQRHSNTTHYVDMLKAADDPEATFVGIVRGLTDPRVSHLGDIRGPIADLVDALDITRRETR